MRPTTLLIAFVLGLAAIPAASGTVLPQPDGVSWAGAPTVGKSAPAFVLTGSGNGHGVGLSQYGSLAQARAGRSAAQILAFYFPGTQPGKRTLPTLRVLLLPAAKTVTLSSTGPLTVTDAAGAAHQLTGPLTLRSDLVVPVDGVDTSLPGPLTVAPARGSFVTVSGHTYRGSLEITPTASALQVVNVVGLEAYVLGVVPGEMPSSWPAAALQAQAISARSYALATLLKGKDWDVYPDGRSQQYLGVDAETPATTAAVRATAGSVLLYNGAVATTFYSSSSGGRTQSGLDAFGLDVPYLPGQADPWDESSPFHLWKPSALTGAQLAKGLGLASPVVDVQTRISAGGRVVALTATAASGATIAVTGSEARKRLGLRSTAFRLATLRFLAPPTATSAGVALRLTGIARDAQDAMLELQLADGTWKPLVRHLRVGPDGTFVTVLRLTQTTTYRLSASGLAGPILTIPVVA